MRSISALIALLFAALMSSSAFGQSAILQGGPWTSGHAPMFSTSGGSQPVVQDSGTAGGGAIGLGLKEFLQVNRGSGSAPYANVGLGPYSANNCFYDGPTTGAYHYLCLDANAQGGALLAVGYGGGASPLPLSFIVNGATYTLPGAGTGNVSSSGTPTSGQLASWVNATDIEGITTGTGVETALGVNVGSPGAFVVNGGALGTPTSGVATNLTGLPLSTGVTGILPDTSMPNLTGDVTTSEGAVATTIANGAVTLAKQADLAANSIQGNDTGSAAVPKALTTSETKALLQIDRGTAITTTSGSTHDFTSIPAWVRRITVMLNGVSLSGTDNFLVQIGDSGGVENTGYHSNAVLTIDPATITALSSTAGIILRAADAAEAFSATVVLVNITGNVWIASGMEIYDGATDSMIQIFGTKTLTAQLDRIRLTVTGADTFDAGTFNIYYE